MWLTILLLSAATTGLSTVLNLWPWEPADAGSSELKWPTIIGSVLTFVVSLLLYVWVFTQLVPPFAGLGIMFWFCPGLLVVMLVFGPVNYFLYDRELRVSASWTVATAVLLVLLVFPLLIWNGILPYKQSDADVMAGQIHLNGPIDTTLCAPDDPNQGIIAGPCDRNKDATDERYPDTDNNHMVIVGDEAAALQASSALKGLGTTYKLDQGALQSIRGEMFYVFSLTPNGIRANSQVNGEATAYMLVSAEDPNRQVEIKDGQHIRYQPNGYFGANLYRYLWNNGYSDGYLDSPTFEIDDSGHPYWTLTYDTPVVRWDQSVPRVFLTVDAETGQITQYDPSSGKIPAWVDRVYSADIVKAMLNWWGRWHAAPNQWFFPSQTNRFKVDGDPTIVYTKEGPAWQALLTSYGDDASVSYVALFDTRSNNVRMYNAPQGLLVQNKVSDIVSRAQNNQTHQYPTNLALHKLYGQLTWVGNLLPAGAQPNEPEGYQGISFLRATDSNGGTVVISQSKQDALVQLIKKLAQSPDNNAPAANSARHTVQGVITEVSPITVGGNSVLYFRLDNNTAVTYSGFVPGNSAMAFAKPGTSVTLTYLDIGDSTDIKNVESFSLAAPAPSR